jgi:hypothetical protein
MTDDTDSVTTETELALALEGNSLPPAMPVAEPDFLARARRILNDAIRPEDYLSVTAEVRRRVERDLEYARVRGNGVPLAAEVEARQIRQELLSFHHGGQNIAYIEDPRGIIVLAVGLEQSSVLIESFPDQVSGRVYFGAPEPDDVWI